MSTLAWIAVGVAAYLIVSAAGAVLLGRMISVGQGGDQPWQS